MPEIRLAQASEIAANSGRAFEVEGRSIAVFRLNDGTLHAAQNRCPHAGASLVEGALGARSIVCPLHKWKFDLASGACLNDENVRLKLYQVREVNGEVWIEPKG